MTLSEDDPKCVVQVDWTGEDVAAFLVKAGEAIEQMLPDKAKDYYESATLIDDSFALAYYRLGKLALFSGDSVLALRALRRAAMLAPGHWETLYRLSQAQAMQGLYKQARSTLRRASTINPNALSVRLLTYIIQLRLGMVERTIDELSLDQEAQKSARGRRFIELGKTLLRHSPPVTKATASTHAQDIRHHDPFNSIEDRITQELIGAITPGMSQHPSIYEELE